MHNSSFKPIVSDSVMLEPKKSSYVSVKRTFIRRQPSPYSQCIDLSGYSSRFYDLIIASNQTYRQLDCFDLCKQEKFTTTCSCFHPKFTTMGVTKGLRQCLNRTDIECIRDIFWAKSFDLEDCAKKQCPLECDSVRYDFTVTSLANGEGSFAQVWVFYQSLEYTLMTEVPKMAFVDLLAQIGGNLGIFVSLSAFTFVEIIQVFFLIFSILFSAKTTNNV